MIKRILAVVLGLLVLASLTCLKKGAGDAKAGAVKYYDTLKTRPCGFLDLNADALPANLNLMPADSVTIRAVSDILDVTGMHLNEQNKNFYLAKSVAFRNVLAISAPVIDANLNLYIYRYIVYNQVLVDSLQNFCSPAAMYVIFAHEISHHLNGDNFMSDEVLQDRRQRELNADSFAGYLCYQLSLAKKFSIDDCLKVFDVIADTVDKDIHPNRALRKLNFSNGWQNAKTFQTISCASMNQIVRDPVAAINEISAKDPAFVQALKHQSEQSISAVKPAKLMQITADYDVRTVVSLRGDSSVMVADKNILRNSSHAKMKSVTRLMSPAELKSSPTERTDYIIDTGDIIWARYPNGVPYVAGVVQTIK